jgi:hypothetical protein
MSDWMTVAVIVLVGLCGIANSYWAYHKGWLAGWGARGNDGVVISHAHEAPEFPATLTVHLCNETQATRWFDARTMQWVDPPGGPAR